MPAPFRGIKATPLFRQAGRKEKLEGVAAIANTEAVQKHDLQRTKNNS
jgi:hypothetical protein